MNSSVEPEQIKNLQSTEELNEREEDKLFDFRFLLITSPRASQNANSAFKLFQQFKKIFRIPGWRYLRQRHQL